MAIQVVHLPNPAAGAEWAYTIPGQYNVTLIGVQATLTVRSPPATAVDSSGNANNATYSGLANIVYGVVGPFGGGGGLAAQITAAVSRLYLASFANAGGQLDLATYSVDALVNYTGTGNVNMNEIFGIRTSDINHPADLRFLYGLSSTGGQRIANTNANVFTLTGVGIALNTWTHVGFSYDGAQWIGYKNGVAGTPVAGNVPGTVTLKPGNVGGDQIANQDLVGKIAAVAYYSGALAAARFLAHSNAVATSSAAYKAAVLADTPVALWMLDETYSTVARVVTLAIQNGAATVATFPTDTPIASPGTYNYSWQTLGPGAAQSSDGTTITVPIPSLTLPPGYVVGSNTPDIATTDQWSNVTVWFDDGTGTPNPSGTFPPYLDALLVPTDWTGAR